MLPFRFSFRVVPAAGVLAIALLTLSSLPAAAACRSHDNLYKYDCWGQWISDNPSFFLESAGDPFSITGGYWLFDIEGTETPGTDMPTSGTASYSGHIWGRGSLWDDDSHDDMLYPVTGDVRASVEFGATDGFGIDFENIKIHLQTNHPTLSPVSLPSQHFSGTVSGNSFTFDSDAGAINRPASTQWYAGNFRRIYRDVAVTGNFYGPDADGIGGKLYYVEGQWKRNKAEVRATPTGFDGCSSNCAPVFWKVDAAWGATKE